MEDLVIKNAKILTMNKNSDILNNSWISVKGNLISGIGNMEAPKAKKMIDCNGKLVMPGLINVHTHASMNLLRGVADDLPLQEWLFNHIFPIENKFINKEFVYWGTKLAIAEMLLSGTTTFVDMYFEKNEAARACEDSGIRGIISWAALNLPTKENPDKIAKKSEDFINKWKKSSLVIPAVGPHSVYTCSEKLLKKMKEVSDKHSCIYHIHVSETEKENKEHFKKHKKSPIKYLNDLNILSEKTLAAHCVHLDKKDIEIIKNKNVRVAYNPESNAKLASGIAPVRVLLENGVTVGIGTDGVASNNNLNLFEEMKFASLIQKANEMDATVLPAKKIVEMATIDGAKCLGLEKEIGSIEKGKKADLIVLDTKKPHMFPEYNTYSNIVYSANGSEVEIVIVNGKVLVENQKIISFDLNEVMKKCRDIVEKIRKFKEASSQK